MKTAWLKQLFFDLISEKRKGVIAFLLRGLLLGCSQLYRFVIGLRNWGYDQGLLASYHPAVSMTVSIGNIVVGGTGKTPLTLLLASALASKPKIAIVSRGYLGKAENHERSTVVCKGEGPLFPASYCGDESYMIAKKLPEIIVVVGKNRKESAMHAAKLGAELILLDDGLQHRAIARDMNIVVLDGKNLFGYGYLLPRGLLREPPKALQRADYIVVNHVEDQASFNAIEAEVKKYTSAPLIGMQPDVVALKVGDQIFKCQTPLKVALFCAIGAPSHFVRLVQKLGMEVVETLLFSDHETPNMATLAAFADLAKKKGAELILCTEKDHVKLHESVQCSLPVVWVEIELRVMAGHLYWSQLLERLDQCIIRNRIINH